MRPCADAYPARCGDRSPRRSPRPRASRRRTSQRRPAGPSRTRSRARARRCPRRAPTAVVASSGAGARSRPRGPRRAGAARSRAGSRVASSTPPAAASNGTSKRYEGNETERPANTEPGGESSAPVRRTTTSATAAAASRATSSHSRRHAGGCAERQLAPFPADLPAQRATSWDEEGERSDEHPACQCDQRRAREVAGLGLPQLAGAEDRESAEKPGDHAERAIPRPQRRASGSRGRA